MSEMLELAVLAMASVLATDYNPTLFGTMSVLEGLWLAINLFGFLFSWGNGRDANADLRAVWASPEVDGGDVQFARWMRRLEWGLWVMQGTNLIIGVWSAFTPHTPQSSFAGMLFGLLFVGKEGVVTWLSFESRKMRQRARAIRQERIRKQEGGN